MCTLTRLGTSAAVSLVSLSATTFAVNTAGASPGASDPTRVVLDASYRNCDFSHDDAPPMVPMPALGTGMALIRTSGSSAAAEVHVAISNHPGTHYDVGLIQEPRPSSATCGPGDPGTSFTGFDTDAAGNGTVTVQSGLRPGTTGVWVIVERANPNSQNPAEYYTSEFVAPV